MQSIFVYKILVGILKWYPVKNDFFKALHNTWFTLNKDIPVVFFLNHDNGMVWNKNLNNLSDYY